MKQLLRIFVSLLVFQAAAFAQTPGDNTITIHEVIQPNIYSVSFKENPKKKYFVQLAGIAVPEDNQLRQSALSAVKKAVEGKTLDCVLLAPNSSEESYPYVIIKTGKGEYSHLAISLIKNGLAIYNFQTCQNDNYAKAQTLAQKKALGYWSEEASSRRQTEENAQKEKEEIAQIQKRSAKNGDTVVSVMKIMQANVPLENEITGDTCVTENEYLIVLLAIQNVSQTKILNYKTWRGEKYSRYARATLEDENGNSYRQISFGATSRIQKTLDEISIYPQKNSFDILVFGKPVDAAKTFTLSLQGKCIESDSDMTISFSKSEIE